MVIALPAANASFWLSQYIANGASHMCVVSSITADSSSERRVA